MKKVVTLGIVAALSLAGAFGTAQAGNQIHRTFDLPAVLTATIEASACSVAPGPQINLQGDLAPAPLNVEVLFRQTGPEVPSEPIGVQKVVVPAGEHNATPPQSIVGSLGENPFMWLQILDEKGRALTSEVFLGRCEQGTFTVSPAFVIPATALAGVSATECASTSGPSVVFDGTTELSGLNARLIFRSNLPGAAPNGRIEQAITEIVIQPTRITYAFPTEAVIANTGGNPLVSTQFRMQDGSAVGPEIRLGRCASLVTQQP
jgi:hypothetical protein